MRKTLVLHLGQLDFPTARDNVVLLGPPPRHRQDPPGDRARDPRLPRRPTGRLRDRDRVGRPPRRRATARAARRGAAPAAPDAALDRRRGRLQPLRPRRQPDVLARQLPLRAGEPDRHLAQALLRLGRDLRPRRTPLSASTPRLGFVVGNAEIVERIDLLQDHARAGIFVPVQEEGIAALSGPQESVAERRDTYQRRRDRVLDALAGTRVAAPVCEGTFYVWIQLPEDMSLEQLLVEHRVAVAPAEGFGTTGAGWARLSVAVTDEQLELGLEWLRRAFSP